MDIFAHGLWAGAVCKTVNIKRRTRFHVWLAVFWGMFPDLFAFAVPFVWTAWLIASGQFDPHAVPHQGQGEPVPADGLPLFYVAHALYNVSHSAIVFALVFCLVSFIRKRPSWEMLGWALHIMIDIPTHSYSFFPTPVLWPVSSWKFDGISWALPWFLISNYFALAVVYLWLWRKRRQTESG